MDKMNKNSLASNQEKYILELIYEYYIRENIDLEKRLFKIVGTSIYNDDIFVKNYEERKNNRLEKFYLLKEFLNLLTEEQINSNIYLKVTDYFIKYSIDDCIIIFEELQKESLKLMKNNKTKIIELSVTISNERIKKFPVINIKQMEEFNEYYKIRQNIICLITNIYQLQLWNMLSKYDGQIDNYKFEIKNIENEYKFILNFSLKINDVLQLNNKEILKR